MLRGCRPYLTRIQINPSIESLACALTTRSTRTPTGGASPTPGSPVTLHVRRPGTITDMRHGHFLARAFVSFALAGTFLSGDASAGERFVQKVTIQAGLVVVVSEGDLEARSTGSYSVRVYSDPSAAAGNETTFYSAGLVRSRDGTVLSVAPLEVPGRKRPLLMVVVQSAGSGGYLSADAFAVEPRSIRLVASVSELAPTEDPSRMLRRKLAGTAR